MFDETIELQPNLPTVYGEPVTFREYRFKHETSDETDDLLHFVNEHAERVADDAKKAREERKQKVIAAINIAAGSSVAFFTIVGMTTVFHWIFG